MTDMTPEEKLANAIIESAANDYIKILKKKHPNQDNLYDKKVIEDFFRSQWYTALTDVDGEYLLRKLKESVKKPSDKKKIYKSSPVDNYTHHKVA